MAREEYWVSPSGTAWVVRRKGVTLSAHYAKQLAIDAGVAVAKANEPSELLIQNENGQIGDRRTYGDDPYPPPG